MCVYTPTNLFYIIPRSTHNASDYVMHFQMQIATLSPDGDFFSRPAKFEGSGEYTVDVPVFRNSELDSNWTPQKDLKFVEGVGVVRSGSTDLSSQVEHFSHKNCTEVVAELPSADLDSLNRVIRFCQSRSLSLSIMWNPCTLSWKTWSLEYLDLFKEYSLHICLMVSNAAIGNLCNWLYEPIKFILLIEPIVNEDNIKFLQMIYQVNLVYQPVLVFDFSINETSKSEIISLIQNSPPLSDEISMVAQNLFIQSVPDIHGLSGDFILQSPLEPAVIDLPLTIYENFEHDKFKYNQYEKALLSAMLRLSSDEQKTCIEVLCVGPGRGPLIDKFFDVVEFLQLDYSSFNITIIERNKLVIPLLRQKNDTRWRGKVSINCQDIRTWDPHTQNRTFKGYNLIFSELIGSLGCNELMPEVLKPLQEFQDSSLCVWIPQCIEAYIIPVQSPQLSLMACQSKRPVSIPLLPIYHYLTNPIKLWEFDYTNLAKEESLNRFKIWEHNVDREARIDGFSGHFKAILFPGIEIDILPHSPISWDSPQTKPYSWFPLLMTFHSGESLYLEPSVNIFIKFSRSSSNNKLVYDFQVKSKETVLGNSFSLELFDDLKESS